MDATGVTAALRSGLWPWLKTHGFDTRTERVGWRYGGETVDIVEIQLVGSLADSVGSTSYSFSATVGSLPSFLPRPAVPMGKDDRPRPHYWHCQLQMSLSKGLSQPWFRPFTSPPNPRLPASFVKHREGLMRVIRRDTHDRADTWFVVEDESNLDEVVADLRAVLQREGLPLLDRFHDPCATLELLTGGRLITRADSPAGRDLITAASRACEEGRRAVSR